MYEQNNYMSEPNDERSESSFIKINKKFIQSLKNNQQIDDLSKYRHQSDSDEDKVDHQIEYQESSEKITFTPKNYLLNSQSKSVMNSKSIYQKDEEIQSSEQEIEKFYQTKKNKPDFFRQQQNEEDNQNNFSAYSNFLNSAKNSHNKTFQYYLMQKQVIKKSKNISKISEFDQSKDSVKQQIISLNRQTRQDKKNSKFEFERVNYKKMLENEIRKNNDLQRRIYELENKIVNLHSLYEGTIEDKRRMQIELTEADKIRRQNKMKIKNLDQKIQGIKKVYKSSYISKDAKEQIEEIRKENKFLKEQNQKYRIFMSSLVQSIFILKGKRPQKLDEIWHEWKLIFQGFSENKWLRSPKASLVNSNSNKKF